MTDAGWTIDDMSRQVIESLLPIGPIVARPLLGTLGLYIEDRVFGLIHHGHTYFRTNEQSIDKYLEAGSMALVLDGTTTEMQYHLVPASVLRDRDLACAWAYEAAAL